MVEQMETMESYVGLKLKEESIKWKQPNKNGPGYYIVTRPDFYGDSIHINLYIIFDGEGVITDFDWDKCRSANRGVYNRSAKKTPMDLTKRDIKYLQNFVKANTEEMQ